jgi:hypothetical protein
VAILVLNPFANVVARRVVVPTTSRGIPPSIGSGASIVGPGFDTFSSLVRFWPAKVTNLSLYQLSTRREKLRGPGGYFPVQILNRILRAEHGGTASSTMYGFKTRAAS